MIQQLGHAVAWNGVGPMGPILVIIMIIGNVIIMTISISISISISVD